MSTRYKKKDPEWRKKSLFNVEDSLAKLLECLSVEYRYVNSFLPFCRIQVSVNAFLPHAFDCRNQVIEWLRAALATILPLLHNLILN